MGRATARYERGAFDGDVRSGIVRGVHLGCLLNLHSPPTLNLTAITFTLVFKESMDILSEMTGSTAY